MNPTTRVSMENSGKVRYLSINSNVFLDSNCAYMDSSNTVYGKSDHGNALLEDDSILVDGNMDHVHSIHST
jgi:hypothetical protein